MVLLAGAVVLEVLELELELPVGPILADMVLPVTMPMSNRRLSNKSMSSNRCGETHVTHLNTLKVDMVWVVVDRPHGRACTMMSRNPWFLQTLPVVDVVDFRKVAAIGDQHRLRLIQLRPLQLMPRPDRRMLASQVRIIVAEAEVDNEVIIHMLDKSFVTV